MCTSTFSVVSKITEEPTIEDDFVISGEDSLTDNLIVIQFHELGTATTCVGNEVGSTRYFHLPMEDYEQMTIAIGDGLNIEIRARERPLTKFTRVDWTGVTT